MEGENVVAYGRLPFLARPTPSIREHMGLCTQLYPENLEPDSCSIRELGTWLYVHNYTRRILNLTPVVSENLEHGSMYPIIPGES